MSGRDIRVLMKLVVDGSSDPVLGCHIVGDCAAEFTQTVAIAVKMKATKISTALELADGQENAWMPVMARPRIRA